jgi:predicted 2-oxoglutarate/Fe(II)-dependent dioxygenase YbiX
MKAGDLLAFPSYLEHGVEPHTSEEDRISIAGNCAC